MRAYFLEYSEPFHNFRYELRISSDSLPVPKKTGKLLWTKEIGEDSLPNILERLAGTPYFEYFDRKRGVLSYEFLLEGILERDAFLPPEKL